MVTEVNDMQELTTLSEDLIKSMNELEDSLKAMKSIVGKANNYDGIDVTTAANILKRNLSAIAKNSTYSRWRYMGKSKYKIGNSK